MITANKCKCGKRINQYANECAKCYQVKRNESRNKSIAIVASNKCPDCGSELHRNLSMLGWYQCNRFGAEGFRLDTTGNQCSFQCFTA